MTFTVAVPLARHGGIQLQLAAIAEGSVDPVTAQSFLLPGARELWGLVLARSGFTHRRKANQRMACCKLSC